MKQYRIYFLLALVVLGMIACSKVPLTGRRQFSLIPDGTINSMSAGEYKTFLSKNQVISTGSEAEMVKRVGQHVAQAVQNYMTQNKAGNKVKDFKWEFNLVESKEVNAWCMPGGKVAVYTGIMPIVKDETGLAVVMGHEIAHAVAEHGSERMTQGLMQQLGAIGLAVAMKDKPAQTQEMFMQAYGIGSSVAVMLPFSRKHETEADKLGLIFMAMAGYDPNQSVSFWERMSKVGGAAPPEILSTHPSNATRIADLKKFIPTALKYYKKTGNTTQPTNNPTRTTTQPTTTNTNNNRSGTTNTNTNTNKSNTNSNTNEGQYQGRTKVKGKVKTNPK